MAQDPDPAQDELWREAVRLHGGGDLQAAADIYRRLLANFPPAPRVLNRLADIAARNGQQAAAAKLLRKSLQLRTGQPLTWMRLGVALKRANQEAAALEAFEQATRLKPDLGEAHFRWGNLLSDLKRHEEAIDCFDRAIACEPGFARAHCSRGNVLTYMGRFDEALASFERAIEADPGSSLAYRNRGLLLADLKRHEEALASYEAAITANPADAATRMVQAELLLLMGKFTQGWALYEWRWKTRFRSQAPEFLQSPLWSGEQPLAGMTVVVRSEVGLGDFIMFARYARLLQERGAQVIVYAPVTLVELCAGLGPGISVIAEGSPLPHFDLQCPIMSLPRGFGTALDTIPAVVPYLTADEGKRRTWREVLGRPGLPRIGLVWSGRANRHIDRSPLRNRSIPLESLQPLLELPFEFHCLQKDLSTQDLESLRGRVEAHHDALKDFSDTAALLAEMDLVISIDTSVAHLAGALGKPLWMMLPFSSDYRWMPEGPRTPWYPTATLFRQPRSGDWVSVVRAVAQRLVERR
jgi:tetratricopeptide (TPR) repeat protein